MTSRRALTKALLLAAAALPVAGILAQTPVAAVASAIQPEVIVVRATLNTQDKGDIFATRVGGGDFLVKTSDLLAMGFRNPVGVITLLDGEPHLSLQSMAGVSLAFEARGLALNITAEPKLLSSEAISMREERRLRAAAPTGGSAFFNYAIDYSGGAAGSANRLGFAAENGLRWGDYLLLSNAASVQRTDGKHSLVRLMSSAIRDDPENLRRWVVGDFFTPSRDFGAGVNMGGISISKLVGIDPYYVQNPMQNIRGSVALPSDLEVYLDGQRIRTERLRPGEFELRDILAYGGARTVQLVLRDAFGRVQQLDYSFYFSDQPLREGLHDYSYNLGAIRRGYGVQSSHYGPAAFTAFHRYGVSDGLTVGLRAEATRELLSAGPSATLVLGSAGVLNLAMGASSIGGRHGNAASVGYNYQSGRWNLGFLVRRDAGDYAALGDPVTVANRAYEGSIAMGYNFPGHGTLTLSHLALTTRVAQAGAPAAAAQPFETIALTPRSVTDLSYSVPLVPGKVSLTARLSRIKDAQSRTEAFVGLTYFLDQRYTATASLRADKSSNAQFVQLSKNQPAGEGLGYLVAADREDGRDLTSGQLRGSLQYNARAAIFRGDYSRHQSRGPGQGSDDWRVSAAGGVAYVGGYLGLARPITDSFGVVKVGALADVPVFVNNQPMGKTDVQGRLFLPTLAAYYDSSVSIGTEAVPIEFSIAATARKVLPTLRSGVVVDFAVVKIRAFSGTLMSRQKEEAARVVEFQEASLAVEGRLRRFQIGRGGDFYLENLQPGRYPATVQVEGRACVFDLTIPESEETLVELGKVVCGSGR